MHDSTNTVRATWVRWSLLAWLLVNLIATIRVW